MNDLSYDEKLRILQLRVEKKNWEVIAEETKHRKSKVIEVGKWLRSLNWGQVRALPVAIQRLRPDYIDYLEQENRQLKQHLRQSLPKVATGTVVLPANNTRIHHGLGQKPSVLLQLHEGQVVSLVSVGDVTPEYFEAQAVTSGPIISWLAMCFDQGSQEEPASSNSSYDY